ncbi:hypothetical protein A1351_14965 [Methylosinus sp. R-45379]|nr:hypothetical protein A1351_14965 [Methylosinus sp. R-45379]
METTAFHFAPIVERMSALMKRSGRLFMARLGRRRSIPAAAGRRRAISGPFCATTAGTAAPGEEMILTPEVQSPVHSVRVGDEVAVHSRRDPSARNRRQTT